MHRRTFLAAALSSIPANAAGDIPKRAFGRTGESLTVIGPAGGRFPQTDFETAKAIVRRAVELGINYYDNARNYWGGRSEEVYGAVLPAFRKQVFITTKSSKRSRAGAEADLHASLSALRTDYIDLWQIHQVGRREEVDQIFGRGGAIEAFEAAKKSGKVRFIGFTGHRDPAVHMEMLKRYDRYDSILMPLNPADPGYLSFEKSVLPEAVRRGLAIQGMKSTANGSLLNDLTVGECISYVLSLQVHSLAMGCTSVAQLDEDVRVARAFRPLHATGMADLRRRAARRAGPELEDWKMHAGRAPENEHHDV